MPFHDLSNTDFLLENCFPSSTLTENLTIIPDEDFASFIEDCNSLSICDSEENSELDIYNNINSKYYHYHHFNKINTNENTSLGICHTNIASINNHIDDLRLTLSLLRYKFDIIAISEHKIHGDSMPTRNINIDGYKPFVFDPTQSSHGGTGFYISESLSYIKRDDLKFNSQGDFESTFIELILPNKKYDSRLYL